MNHETISRVVIGMSINPSTGAANVVDGIIEIPLVDECQSSVSWLEGGQFRSRPISTGLRRPGQQDSSSAGSSVAASVTQSFCIGISAADRVLMRNLGAEHPVDMIDCYCWPEHAQALRVEMIDELRDRYKRSAALRLNFIDELDQLMARLG